YGGTYNLLKYTLKRLGVETTFIDNINDLDEWRGAIRDNTKLLFGETLSNPDQKVLDVRGLADVAHDAGVPLFVDNTVATPYLLRPIEHGADVVIHSATKYLGGHGTSIAGVLVDAGTFDYAADPAKFPQFNEPSESYH
ncbi:aminotransferase class V-fold PLP-dependent enzyme, partial [Stenotrophomonas maltophilia]|nr:aminotransferase class V-fold PLP-dependent enzyme [Stenotrophomonas maltophilia]